MAHYSRNIAHESRAADQVLAKLLSYPLKRQVQGVTVKKLLRDHPDQLKSDISVIAALDLLTEEGKVIREKSTGHAHPYDSIRLYPVAHQELYKDYGIEVRLRPFEDGTFNAHGFIRTANSAFTGLPFETTFDTHGQRHPTADAALQAGIAFAKTLIDRKPS